MVNHRRTARAMNLIEVMVLLLVSGLVLAPAMMAYYRTIRTVERFADECLLSASVARALDEIGRDVRSAAPASLREAGDGSVLELRGPAGERIVYRFAVETDDAGAHGRLIRIEGGQERALPLDGLDSLAFRVLPRGEGQGARAVEVRAGIAAVTEYAADLPSPAGGVRTVYRTRSEEPR